MLVKSKSKKMCLDVQLVLSAEPSSALREIWGELDRRCGAPDFYLTADWISAVLRFTADAVGPLRLLIIRQDQQVVGIVPLHVRKRAWRGIRVTVLALVSNIYSPRVSALVHADHVADAASCISRFLCTEMRSSWDVLELAPVAEADPIMGSVVRALQMRGCRVVRDSLFQSIRARIGDRGERAVYFDAISKHVKQNVRTGINRLRRDGDIQLALLSAPSEEVETFIDSYYEVFADSWKEPEAYPNFHRELIHALLPNGIVRLFLLYAVPALGRPATSAPEVVRCGIPAMGSVPRQGRCLAACLFMLHGKQAHFLKTAYRDSARFTSAGAVLLWLALKHLIEVDGVEAVDFQRGTETYKRDFGSAGDSYVRYRILQHRSVRGHAAMLLESFAIRASRAIKVVRGVSSKR